MYPLCVPKHTPANQPRCALVRISPFVTGEERSYRGKCAMRRGRGAYVPPRLMQFGLCEVPFIFSNCKIFNLDTNAEAYFLLGLDVKRPALDMHDVERYESKSIPTRSTAFQNKLDG